MALARNEQNNATLLPPEAIGWTLRGIRRVTLTSDHRSIFKRHRVDLLRTWTAHELAEHARLMKAPEVVLVEPYPAPDSDVEFFHSAIRRYTNTQLLPLVNRLRTAELPTEPMDLAYREYLGSVKPNELGRAEILVRELNSVVSSMREAIPCDGMVEAPAR